MSSDKLTPEQVLFPVCLLSLVVALFLGFQTTLLVADRDTLHKAHDQQDKPLEQVEKIKTQLNALAMGTLKLSEQGNKDAQTIIAELKKSGIEVSDQPPQQQGSAAPGAGMGQPMMAQQPRPMNMGQAMVAPPPTQTR